LQEKGIAAVDLGGLFEQLFAGWVVKLKALLASRPPLVINEGITIVIEREVSVVWALAIGTAIQI
jgi:hypothetical protein